MTNFDGRFVAPVRFTVLNSSLFTTPKEVR